MRPEDHGLLAPAEPPGGAAGPQELVKMLSRVSEARASEEDEDESKGESEDDLDLPIAAFMRQGTAAGAAGATSGSNGVASGAAAAGTSGSPELLQIFANAAGADGLGLRIDFGMGAPASPEPEARIGSLLATSRGANWLEAAEPGSDEPDSPSLALKLRSTPSPGVAPGEAADHDEPDGTQESAWPRAMGASALASSNGSTWASETEAEPDAVDGRLDAGMASGNHSKARRTLRPLAPAARLIRWD